jgi:hypothetical protein
MRYPIISPTDATQYLYVRRNGDPVDVTQLAKARGEGAKLSLDFIMPLMAALNGLRARFPEGLKGRGLDNQFEAEAARIIHREVAVPAEVVADPDFWLWLAVAYLSDVVEWRYGSPTHGTGLANYGIGNRSENFIFRLWLRADLVLDEQAGDPYHLSRRGQIDFYRSHLFRQGYANAGGFARALLRFQYPESDGTTPRLKIVDIRELVKRLRRLRTNLFLEILNEDDCRRVIEAEAQRVLVAA